MSDPPDGCIAASTANDTCADNDATLRGFGGYLPVRDLQLVLALDVLHVPCCELFCGLACAPLPQVFVHEILEVALDWHEVRGAHAEAALTGVVELVPVRDGTHVEPV